MTEIVGVALYFSKGAILYLPRPSRHHDLLHVAKELGIESDLRFEATQGFLTNNGDFVNRYYGAYIATKAGQRLRVIASPDTLYSEELW